MRLTQLVEIAELATVRARRPESTESIARSWQKLDRVEDDVVMLTCPQIAMNVSLPSITTLAAVMEVADEAPSFYTAQRLGREGLIVVFNEAHQAVISPSRVANAVVRSTTGIFPSVGLRYRLESGAGNLSFHQADVVTHCKSEASIMLLASMLLLKGRINKARRGFLESMVNFLITDPINVAVSAAQVEAEEPMDDSSCWGLANNVFAATASAQFCAQIPVKGAASSNRSAF